MAQQGALPEIGVLDSVDVGPIKDRADAFFEGLEDAHYAVGRKVTVEYRSAEGRVGLLSQLAAELVRRNPAVLVCISHAVRPALLRLAKSGSAAQMRYYVRGIDVAAQIRKSRPFLSNWK